MKGEPEKLRELFKILMREPKQRFPRPHEQLDAPTSRGVYVIYDPKGRPAHVGMTPRAKKGIRQRLGNHLAGRSSFVVRHLKRDGSKLRGRYEFQCLPVSNDRIPRRSERHRFQLSPGLEWPTEWGPLSQTTMPMSESVVAIASCLPSLTAECAVVGGLQLHRPFSTTTCLHTNAIPSSSLQISAFFRSLLGHRLSGLITRFDSVTHKPWRSFSPRALQESRITGDHIWRNVHEPP